MSGQTVYIHADEIRKTNNPISLFYHFFPVPSPPRQWVPFYPYSPMHLTKSDIKFMGSLYIKRFQYKKVVILRKKIVILRIYACKNPKKP